MQRTRITNTELSIIPNEGHYFILYSSIGLNWIHEMKHKSLPEALVFINKIAAYGSIDLQRWGKTQNEYDFIMLINSLKPTKNKIHLWNGRDSFCSMWSTGGLKQDRHILTLIPPADVFCSHCVDQYRRLVPKDKQKLFDANYRLVSTDLLTSCNPDINDIHPNLF